MRKRVLALLLCFALAAGLVWVGFAYFGFVSRMVFEESTAHLAEIFHQANQALYNLVSVNWSRMRMWAPYLEKAESDEEIVDYVNLAREESYFTDFYFISRDGEYLTLTGGRGYLDLRDQLPALILDQQPIVVNSVVPDQPEIMVFAIPTVPGSYRGYAYEAIAITFNNADLVEALKISAFGGQASTYAVLPDGRIAVDNSSASMRDIRNLFVLLEESGSLTEQQIAALRADFLAGNSGAMVFSLDGRDYYLVYESANFQNWTVIGIVPANVVNASMNKLQSTTMLVVSGIAIALAVVILLLVVQQNRQKLRRKDNQLLARDELFSKLSINVDDVFLMIDARDLRTEYVSPNIEKLIGISEQKVLRDVHELERLSRCGEAVQILDQLATLQPGEQREWDREYVHQKTGEELWFRVVVFCTDIQGEKKYILDLSDRTKEKKINQRLEDAVRTAENASRAKTTFLNNMSHDIRTPMNAIIGFTTLAAAHVDNAELVQGYLAKIQTASSHLMSLINDVLDMSRIESGKVKIEEKKAHLPDLIHDLRTIVQADINAKQLEFFIDSMDVRNEDIICDKLRLNQVLLNLLSNAMKFTKPGGMVSLRIIQTRDAPSGYAGYEFRVKDTGIGMSREFQQHIFEAFTREQSSTVSGIQGTGLGMAITKSIVDIMGGSITVDSELGKGTEFVVKLRFRVCGEPVRYEPIPDLMGLRALVADDDANACMSIASMLGVIGMRPEWTTSGKEAVLRAQFAIDQGEEFQAYIIDWLMPDMNGIEVVRRIRRIIGDGKPIIILTAYDWSNIEEEPREAGVTGFCTKQLFMTELRELLTRPETLHKAAAAEETHVDYAGKRLLLVEDNELNQEIAVEILRGMGFAVDVEADGVTAVERMRRAAPGDYDLILMDIQMPHMDGYEATRRIRQLPDPAVANIPILAMTANAFEDDKQEALAAGMNGHIAKPIEVPKLEAMLRKMLRK